MITVVIATIKQVHKDKAKKFINKNEQNYNIHIIDQKEDLSLKVLDSIKPEYIFFPHWSWIIPEEIFCKYKCIIFHTAPLPFGRGGSPIQNQIIKGYYSSVICAIECVKDLDAGGIYHSVKIDLSKGSLDEILDEISNKIYFELIPHIIKIRPEPIPQVGDIYSFKRRKPEESSLNSISGNLDKYHDFIRMLDGEGYPKAFVETKSVTIEFSNSIKRNGYLEGRFKLYER